MEKNITKKRVVVIGGGNGSAIAVVALKQHLDVFDISAVVSMSDSNGSSGRLRRELNTLPPGDILRVILAMSKYDYPLLRQIFYRNRFSNTGKLDKHDLGNLFLVLSARYGGDFAAATRALGQSLETVGPVYPVTMDKTDLCAELSNGKIIKTEAAIDIPSYSRSLKIKRVWLEPAGQIYAGAKKVIEQADYIVLAPGSLYTSDIAALLPKGVKEAISKSKAKLIYTSGDAYQVHGETGPEKLSEFVYQLEKYLPRPVDLVIYNNHQLTPKQKNLYVTKGWGIFEADFKNLKNHQVIQSDYSRDEGGLCSIRLGRILTRIISPRRR